MEEVKKLELYCPYENIKCKCIPEGKILFEFVGIQKNPIGADLAYYNCPKGFTFVDESVKKYNKERK